MLIKLYQILVIGLLTMGLIIFQKSRRIVFFILWPLTKYLLGTTFKYKIAIGNNVVMYVYGSVVDMVNKVLLYYSRFHSFAWEPRTSRIFQALLSPESTVIVAGGHIGYYALLAGSVATKGRVDVFEPVPEIYEKLKENIRLNSFTNITAIHGALSENGQVVTIISDHAQSSIVESSHNKELHKYQVASYRLDDYCITIKNDPTTILLDVEGFELFVFQGAERILANHPDIIFEVNAKMLRSAGANPQDLFNFLTVRGYQLFLIEDEYDTPSLQPITVLTLHRLQDLAPKNAGTFFNALATTRIDEIQKRSKLKISIA